ncbi:hypothetical protein LTR53_013822, partial [Teratosphaeriaceae sp. CCFEE 6253]
MKFVRNPIVNSPYPLAQALANAFGEESGKRVSSQGRNRKDQKFATDFRNDVISESLCDDALAYLAPTLEKHKGCTIVDFHPGACLWSSKLHDFLKPKRHVLMEPETRYYEPFIRPLLEKPGSTYRYTALSGAHPHSYWQNYGTVFADPELAPRKPLPADDPRLRELDPSLLVVGNLARQYKIKRRAGAVNFGSFIIQQWLTAALGNHLIYNSGLVRSLFWTPEADKLTLFPVNESHRRSLTARLSVGCSMNEAVGTVDLFNLENIYYARRRQRPAVLETLLADRVRRRMQEQGMRPPESRDFLYERLPPGSEKVPSPFESTVRTVDELTAQITAIEA